MSVLSDSLLSFTVNGNTPVQQVLALHDAYLRTKGRRRAIEHAVAILGGMVIILYASPLHAPITLLRLMLLGWIAMVVLFGVLGVSELLLLRRRERLLSNITR
jgi:hypothetical protein